MRKVLLCGLMAALSAAAAEWTGYISDAACGWNNARPGKEAKECAQKCVNAGWDPVFVQDGQIGTHKIRDKAKVIEFVGDHVTISGKLEGDTIAVTRIRRTPARKSR